MSVSQKSKLLIPKILDHNTNVHRIRIGKLAMFNHVRIQTLSKQSRSNFCKLLSDATANPCCIALGAGASASVGLPTWYTLLNRISYCYFYQWAFDIAHNKALFNKPPSDMSVAMVEAYDVYLLEKQHPEIAEMMERAFDNAEHWHNGTKLPEKIAQQKNQQMKDSSTLIHQLQDSFMDKVMSGDLTVIAQMIKNQIRPSDWDYLIRKALYKSYKDDPFILEISPLYKQLMRFVEQKGVNSILNYNYDDTFYHALQLSGIRFENCYNNSNISAHKKIVYPHGYIPMKGGIRTEIVLTESDYQNQIYQQNLWSNNIQTSILSANTCIFVGLSLNDSNIRRLINMCSGAKQYMHYAFLPASGQDEASTMYDSLCDSDLYRLGIRVVRYPAQNGHEMLTELFSLLCDHL